MSNNSPNNRPLTPRQLTPRNRPLTPINRQLTRKNRNNSNQKYIVKLAELPPLSELERRVIICEEILSGMQNFNCKISVYSLKTINMKYILLTKDMADHLGWKEKERYGIIINKNSDDTIVIIKDQYNEYVKSNYILPKDIYFLDTTPINFEIKIPGKPVNRTGWTRGPAQTVARGTVDAISFETISQTLFETRLQIYEFKRSRKINGMNALNWSQQAFEPGQY